jgi:hypothetical protein
MCSLGCTALDSRNLQGRFDAKDLADVGREKAEHRLRHAAEPVRRQREQEGLAIHADGFVCWCHEKHANVRRESFQAWATRQVRAANEAIVSFYKGLGDVVEERASLGRRL